MQMPMPVRPRVVASGYNFLPSFFLIEERCLTVGLGATGAKKTRERFLAASLTEGTCRARACNLRGKGLALRPLDHRGGCKRTEGVVGQPA